MKMLIGLVLAPGLVVGLAGCGGSSSNGGAPDPAEETHTHDDGSTHEDHADESATESAGADEHAHDETSLGTVMIGELEVELAQGHGAVAAGHEGHLVVKLPYTDGGATVVRAWIGTEDRTLSFVGRGEYAASHDDYDIHAMAPDPLPEGALWWIEIERPDGTTIVGSAEPIME
jgi:hypothetical protein